MREIFNSLRLIIVAVGLGAMRAAELVDDAAKRYLQGLKQLATVAILFPIGVTVIGYLAEGIGLCTPETLHGVISTAGIWCTLWLVILATWASPIALFVGILLKKNEEAAAAKWRGEWYVKLVMGTLLWEALTYLFLSFVPIENNWQMVPTFVLTILVMILVGMHWGYSSELPKKTLKILIPCMLLWETASFFPGFALVKHWAGRQINELWREWTLVFGPYSLMAIVGLLAILLMATTWKLVVAGRNGSAGGHSETAASGHGVHGSGGHGKKLNWVRVAAIILIVLAVIGLWDGSVQRFFRETGRAQAAPVANNPSGMQAEHLFAYPGTNYVAVNVGNGMTALWEADSDENVLFHYSDESPRDDRVESRNTRTVLPVKTGSYTVYFRAAGLNVAPFTFYRKPM